VTFICLISGDEQAVVQSMCTPLSFDQCMGDLRPEQKSEHIRWLQAGGYGVCMIGDGVNDALALSTADLGLAVGAGGSDAALEAADIVLMGHDLRDVLALRSLSRSTMRVIDQNFWIGAGSDYAGLGLAIVGLLTPFLGGVIHVGHTLAILANSARLLGWRGGSGVSVREAKLLQDEHTPSEKQPRQQARE
jgi:cation-transporting P-type ATPase C